MNAIINGKKRDLPEYSTLADLLNQSNVKPAQVVVEHNGAIIDRARLAETRLAQNDIVEIVHFVGGG